MRPNLSERSSSAVPPPVPQREPPKTPHRLPGGSDTVPPRGGPDNISNRHPPQGTLIRRHATRNWGCVISDGYTGVICAIVNSNTGKAVMRRCGFHSPSVAPHSPQTKRTERTAFGPTSQDILRLRYGYVYVYPLPKFITICNPLIPPHLPSVSSASSPDPSFTLQLTIVRNPRAPLDEW